MATRQEQRTIALGQSTKGVGCRVTDDVSLGLDDPTRQPPRRMLMDERFPDQISGERLGVDRQFVAAQSPDRPVRFGGRRLAPSG